MDGLIATLLYYTQVGRAELNLAPTDLGVVARRVIDAMAPVITRSGARVTIAPDLPVVLCDPARAAEVLQHLISNAILFNKASPPLVELGLRAADEDGHPVIFVRDNGVGVPEQHHQTVFRMFKRLHGREEYGAGMGAGLAFVKKIAERHGGRVWIEAAPGGGSVFLFTLGREAHAVDVADTDR